jgi:hypothetical protein
MLPQYKTQLSYITKKVIEMATDVEGPEGFQTRDYEDPPPTPFFDADELTKFFLRRSLSSSSSLSL